MTDSRHLWDLSRNVAINGRLPKSLHGFSQAIDLQKEVFQYAQNPEQYHKNIKKDASRLAFHLVSYISASNQIAGRENIESYIAVVALKYLYGDRYLILRNMALQTMPSEQAERFGYINQNQGKKQMAFNRGDFKKAAKSMGFNPALIKKSDEVISKAIEDVGRKVIKPEQLTNRIARDLKCDPFKAKEYMDKYRSHKPVQQQPQVMNLLNFKQATQLTKVQGKEVKLKAQDAWANESEFTGDAKKYTLANKKMAELRVPQHAKIDVKQLLLTSKLPEAQ